MFSGMEFSNIYLLWTVDDLPRGTVDQVMHRGEEKRLKVNSSVECKRPLIPLYAANKKNLEAVSTTDNIFAISKYAGSRLLFSSGGVD